MAAPAIVACTADTWKKVATNVTKCRIWKLLTTSDYRMTYVLTGAAAPTGLTGAVRILTGAYHDFPTASAAVDIYIYCPKVAGSVRVDT